MKRVRRCRKCKRLRRNEGHGLCRKCYRARPSYKRRSNLLRKAWHKENPAKQFEYDLKRHYGVTIAQYNALLKKQKGVCKICRQPPVRHRRLCVDHDHDTGKVRALLCAPCNTIVGILETHRMRLSSMLRSYVAYLNMYERLPPEK